MGLIKKFKKLVTLESTITTEEDVIRHYLKSRNNKLQEDEHWNLYLINPGTPLICAHLDTVKWYTDHQQMKDKGLNMQYWMIKVKDDWILWADDRAWVAIWMQIYEDIWDNVSLLFCSREETWRHGSIAFAKDSKELLEQCQYCIVPDRMHPWDIIWHANKYCSKEFEDVIAGILHPFWYEPTKGVLCDADSFSGIINSVNMSVGYYWQHTKTEFIVLDEFKNAYMAILYLISSYKKKMDPYKSTIQTYKGYRNRDRTKDRDDYGVNYGNFERGYDRYGNEYEPEADKEDDPIYAEVEWDMLYVYEDIEIRDSTTDRITKLKSWDYRINKLSYNK